MAQDKVKLKKLLEIIKLLIQENGNDWFKRELTEMTSKGDLSANSALERIGIDVKWLTNYLRIDIPESRLENFSFIPKENQTRKDQLKLDNIQMWRAFYGKSNIEGKPDFDNVVIFTHFQIEELLNLYFDIYGKNRMIELGEIFFNQQTVSLEKNDKLILLQNGEIEPKDIFSGDLIYYYKIKNKLPDIRLYQTQLINEYKGFLKGDRTFDKMRKLQEQVFYQFRKEYSSNIYVDFESIRLIQKYRNVLLHRSEKQKREPEKERERLFIEKFNLFEKEKNPDRVTEIFSNFLNLMRLEFERISKPENDL